MSLLTRETVLGAKDLSYEDVTIPEWGGDLRIRMVSAGERDAWEAKRFASHRDDPEARLQNIRAGWVALCAVDDQGRQLFTVEDIEALGKKSSLAVDRAFEVAQRINAVGNKEQEALRKNSAIALSGALPSG